MYCNATGFYYNIFFSRLELVFLIGIKYNGVILFKFLVFCFRPGNRVIDFCAVPILYFGAGQWPFFFF
jgi:hypothetical protein